MQIFAPPSQASFWIFFNIYDNKKRSGTVLRLLTTLFMKSICHLELFIYLAEYNQQFIVYHGEARSNANRGSPSVGSFLDFLQGL